PAFPADATVCRSHVCNRCSCPCRCVHIGAGNQVGDLVATPTLALDGHFLIIHPWLLPQFFHPGIDVFLGGPSRIPDLVLDVGCEDEVTVAYEKADVEAGWGGGWGNVAVKPIR